MKRWGKCILMFNNREIKVDKDNQLPLYFQLKEIIKKDIEAGKLKSDEPIPSERELIEHYQISRTPVRQAINELVYEGYLIREHGKGTFVAKKKIDRMMLEYLGSFDEEMKVKGFINKTKVLSKREVKAISILKEIFGSEYEKYYRIERLRFIDNEPYVIVTTFIPSVLAPNLLEEDLEQQSLYKTLTNKYNFHIDYASRMIEANLISADDAEKLEVDSVTAVQVTRTTAYLDNGKPFEYSIGRHRSDLSSFTVKVDYKE